MLMFSKRKVNLGKRIERANLISILLQTAREMGLHGKAEDEFEREYALGSVRELSIPDGTGIILRGRLLKAMTVSIIDGSQPDSFTIYRGAALGYASERTVRRYLEAVSAHL